MLLDAVASDAYVIGTFVLVDWCLHNVVRCQIVVPWHTWQRRSFHGYPTEISCQLNCLTYQVQPQNFLL